MPAFSRGLWGQCALQQKLTRLVVFVSCFISLLVDLSYNVSVDEYMFFELLKVRSTRFSQRGESFCALPLPPPLALPLVLR